MVTSNRHRVEDMAIKMRDEIRNWNVEWVPAHKGVNVRLHYT